MSLGFLPRLFLGTRRHPRQGTGPQEHVMVLLAAMKAGFAKTVAPKLAQLLEQSEYSRSHAKIAWHLARWYHSQGHAQKVLEYLEIERQLSTTSPLDIAHIVLEAEAHRSLGRLAAAQGLLQSAIRRDGEHTELCLSAANLPPSDGGREFFELNMERLAWLNKPFERAGLCLLSLRDNLQGLTFDNLVAAGDPSFSSDIKVSVLVPVYNAERTVGTAITSLLDQTWTNLEVIAVDDGSTDETWDILQSYAASDPRLLPIRHGENLGAYAARNTALRLASGEFVTVSDADDWVHPQRVRIQAEHLKKTGALCNTTASIRVDSDVRVNVNPRAEMLRESFPSLMMRREDALGIGGWDEVRMGADAEFYDRLLAMYQHQKHKILEDVPLTLQLNRASSLTQMSFIGRSTMRYGARREYAEAYAYWHRLAAEGESSLCLPSVGRAFPIPKISNPRSSSEERYDVLFVVDCAAQSCWMNPDTLMALKLRGLRLASLHWPALASADKAIARPIRKLLHDEMAGAVVAGDKLKCKLVIADASLLVNVPDILPDVTAKTVVLIVDSVDALTQLTYKVDQARSVFGIDPLLAPTSRKTQKKLRMLGEFSITEETWPETAYIGALVKNLERCSD